MGIEPTSEAWELSETATYAPVSVRTNMSIRKERYWLRNRELVHGAKMYVMPQLGVRISWREQCKPGPRHQDLLFVLRLLPFPLHQVNCYVGSNQAAATKVSSLSITSVNPATIRICIAADIREHRVPSTYREHRDGKKVEKNICSSTFLRGV
jgi:hypothetical protein